MNSKTKKGVMVMKDGKAWGVAYKDGYCTSYGFVDPVEAKIYDPNTCVVPSDVANANDSRTLKALVGAEVVEVERTTSVRIINT